MHRLVPALLCVFALVLGIAGAIDVYSGLRVTQATRSIDLSTQLARHNVTVEATNGGSQPTSEFYLAVEEPFAQKLAFLSAREEPAGKSLSVGTASATQTTKSGIAYRLYRVALAQSLPAGGSTKLSVFMVFSKAFQALPKEISQFERQYMKYDDNLYFFSPYAVASQKTVVTLATSTIESYSKQTPFNVIGNEITYGPYENVEAFQTAELSVHSEHPGPFLTVTHLEKIIEISHWGNINVEEHYELVHSGAKLRGQFSRYEYRRGKAFSVVRSVTHVLPADARDIYYRDEIGNISTSAVRSDEDHVYLEMTPRFPLFGGWKTQFYMGYDLPIYNYLFTDVNTGKSVLNISFAKTFDVDVLIDELTVKIILPEGCSDIQAHLPFEVEEESRDLHLTYLDTRGRPVVVLKKRNVVAEHDQPFQLTYNFGILSMLHEPLLLVGVYFLFFLLVIVYVRFSLSISPDGIPIVENRPETIGIRLKAIHHQRKLLQKELRNATAERAQQKISDTQYAKVQKEVLAQLSLLQDEVTVAINDLQEVDANVAAQVRQIDRQEKAKQAYLDQLNALEIALAEERVTKSAYEQSKAQFEKFYGRLEDEINRLIADLVVH